MAAILENGRHNRPRHNLAWRYSYIYLFWYDVHVCQVSCFYHKMHDFSLICWTTTISKVFEIIVYDQLFDYLTVNGILYNSQYGFRKPHSTQMATIELIDSIFKNWTYENSKFPVFLDMPKAFDTLVHNILFKMLEHYGINRTPLSWLMSYLTDRLQFLSFLGEHSDIVPI